MRKEVVNRIIAKLKEKDDEPVYPGDIIYAVVLGIVLLLFGIVCIFSIFLMQINIYRYI